MRLLLDAWVPEGSSLRLVAKCSHNKLFFFFLKQPREDYWAVREYEILRSSLCIYSECILFVCTLLIALLNQLDCSVGVEPDPE